MLLSGLIRELEKTPALQSANCSLHLSRGLPIISDKTWLNMGSAALMIRHSWLDVLRIST